MHELRLDGAIALLGKETASTLADPQRNPVQYMQGIIDGLCDLSLRDPLTGCANRRHFEVVLERELDRVVRSGEIALLLMIDVDHFKCVNDLYGHSAGDAVLHQVAQCIAGCIRPMDTLARYGGEEFAVVLPACQPAYGRSIAERIRKAVESMRLRLHTAEVIQVTVSIGGAYALQWIRSTNELWTQRADQRLYIAKSEGRNRIEIEEQPDSTVSAEEKSLLFAPDYHHSDMWSSDILQEQGPLDPTDSVN